MVEIKTSNGTVFLRRDAVLSLSVNLNAAGKPIAAETIAIVTGGAAVLLHAQISDVAKALGFDRDDEPTPLNQFAVRVTKMIDGFEAKRQQMEAIIAARMNGFGGIGPAPTAEQIAELNKMVDEFDPHSEEEDDSEAWKKGRRDAA